jgi:PTH1 family peptidyl-tRNA hydrolase
MVLDHIAEDRGCAFSPGQGNYYFCKITIGQQDTVLIKPSTFMNRSGEAVKHAADFFQVAIDQILVIYDDFHLRFGELRFRKKGSAAGHNGIESLINLLNTNEIQRLKIGIGSEFDEAVEFVLSKFSRTEMKQLPELIKLAGQGVYAWLNEGMTKAMNAYNRNVLIDTNVN